MATKNGETKIKVAREKVLTLFRSTTDRTRREVKEELERLAASDYRVSRIHRTAAGVEIDMAKVEDWTLEELIGEAETLLSGGR